VSYASSKLIATCTTFRHLEQKNVPGVFPPIHSHGQAGIASNIIGTNSGNGINVSGGQDSGTAIEAAANWSSAGQENAGVEINCQLNSSMNGR
jgi:hypothetical protein